MLQSGEGENEILLGNKQLLGIFFVVVLLLGIAFAGGYKLGQGSKKPSSAAGAVDTASSSANAATETHDVPAPTDVSGSSSSPASADAATASSQAAPETAASTPEPAPNHEAPLGSPKHKPASHIAEDTEAPGPATPAASARPEPRGDFVPEPGQMFLQVAAVGRDEAEAVADVLHKRGFHAHAVPKPGNAKIYRVLIGPLKDAADLSATREALRQKAGFREVITQRY